MKGRLLSGFRIITGIVVITLAIGSGTLHAQILKDSTSMGIIKKGIDYIYNQETGKADEIMNYLNARYPGNPATYMFKGLSLYYRYYPLVPDSPECRNFEAQLRACIRVSELKDGWINDPERLMIDLCARGLLMMFYTENDMSSEATPIALTTYKGVRKSFEFTSVYPDFNFFTGLYNYYREAYPDRHPVYKTIAFLFPRGDRKKGLEQLKIAAENSIVLEAEANSMISWIYVYYENNFHEAIEFSKGIYEKYPSNLMFRGDYIENLILAKRYDEAEKLLLSETGPMNRYFTGQSRIFEGLIREKKYRDYPLAGKLYTEGIYDLKDYGVRAKDYTEYGSKGLDRIKAAEKRRKQ